MAVEATDRALQEEQWPPGSYVGPVRKSEQKPGVEKYPFKGGHSAAGIITIAQAQVVDRTDEQVGKDLEQIFNHGGYVKVDMSAGDATETLLAAVANPREYRWAMGNLSTWTSYSTSTVCISYSQYADAPIRRHWLQFHNAAENVRRLYKLLGVSGPEHAWLDIVARQATFDVGADWAVTAGLLYQNNPVLACAPWVAVSDATPSSPTPFGIINSGDSFLEEVHKLVAACTERGCFCLGYLTAADGTRLCHQGLPCIIDLQSWLRTWPTLERRSGLIGGGLFIDELDYRMLATINATLTRLLTLVRAACAGITHIALLAKYPTTELNFSEMWGQMIGVGRMDYHTFLLEASRTYRHPATIIRLISWSGLSAGCFSALDTVYTEEIQKIARYVVIGHDSNIDTRGDVRRWLENFRELMHQSWRSLEGLIPLGAEVDNGTVSFKEQTASAVEQAMKAYYDQSLIRPEYSSGYSMAAFQADWRGNRLACGRRLRGWVVNSLPLPENLVNPADGSAPMFKQEDYFEAVRVSRYSSEVLHFVANKLKGRQAGQQGPGQSRCEKLLTGMPWCLEDDGRAALSERRLTFLQTSDVRLGSVPFARPTMEERHPHGDGVIFEAHLDFPSLENPCWLGYMECSAPRSAMVRYLRPVGIEEPDDQYNALREMMQLAFVAMCNVFGRIFKVEAPSGCGCWGVGAEEKLGVCSGCAGSKYDASACVTTLVGVSERERRAHLRSTVPASLVPDIHLVLLSRDLRKVTATINISSESHMDLAVSCKQCGQERYLFVGLDGLDTKVGFKDRRADQEKIYVAEVQLDLEKAVLQPFLQDIESALPLKGY
jgi:hypothetical protein